MKISDSCYAVQGLYFLPPWSVNAGFIVGQDRTLIIDTGSNKYSAETIYGYASAAGGNNKIEVINTEQHMDHIGGNCLFLEKGISIFGHSSIERPSDLIVEYQEEFNNLVDNSIRRSLQEGQILLSTTYVVNPECKIDGPATFALGNLAVEVIPTPGHTPSNLSIFVPADGVLFSGDCIVSKFIPNLEEGTVQDWQQWKESILVLRSLSPQVCVPGHGPVLTSGTEILQELAKLERIIDNAIETGRAPTLE